MIADLSPFFFFAVAIPLIVGLALHGPMIRVKCTNCGKLNLLSPLIRRNGKCKCGNKTFLYIKVIYHYVIKEDLVKIKKYKLCVIEGKMPLPQKRTPDLFSNYFDFGRAEKEINLYLQKSPTPYLVYFYPEFTESLPEKIKVEELYEAYLATFGTRNYLWCQQILHELVSNFPDCPFTNDAQIELNDLNKKLGTSLK